MVHLFFTMMLIFPVLMGAGKLFERLMVSFWKGLSGMMTAGALFLAIVWMGIAFFTAIGFTIEVLSIGVGLLSFFYHRLYNHFYEFLKEHYRIFIPGMLLILFAGTFYPYILDHFGYYVPTILWISEFGLVKGIANVDLLLGQMSLWHIFQAGFSHIADPYLRMNSIFLLIYFIYACEKKSWLHLFVISFLILFSQSPSPDLPVIVLSMMIMDQIFKQNSNITALFLVSVFAFVIKPTMIWMPILTFLYGLMTQRKNTIVWIWSGSFVFIIFILKNIWCFGFPIFPASFIDLDVPWKPNATLLKISSQIAVEKTFDMQYDYQEIQNFNTFEYIKNWLLLRGLKSIINILFIITLSIFIVFSFVKKNMIISLLCLSIIIKSVIVLLFSAQYRFFLDVFFVVFFVIAYRKISKKISICAFFLLNLFFIGLLAFPNGVKKIAPSFRLGQYMLGFQESQLLHPSYFQLKEFDKYQIGNLKFNLVKGYPFSFDIPLPAISPEFLTEDEQAGIFPQSYDNSRLARGFYWKELTEEEKQKIQKIVDKVKHDFRKRTSKP